MAIELPTAARNRTINELAMIIFRKTGSSYNGCAQIAEEIVDAIEDGKVTYVPSLIQTEGTP